tara:strand:- start:1443 stop:2012 length:570 start_codon:yes stop_codon:yes gene_type:complete
MLIRKNITPNQLYLMWAMTKSVTTPLINISLELRNLKTKGFLLEDSKLSPEALEIVEELSAFYKKRKKKSDIIVMGESAKENSVIYNEIFPKIKLDTGRNARSAIGNVKPGLRWFFDNNDYTWEEIHAATKAYVTDRELNNNKFFTCSQYFVRKQMTDKTWISLLADWCQSVRDGLEGPSENPFQEKIF